MVHQLNAPRSQNDLTMRRFSAIKAKWLRLAILGVASLFWIKLDGTTLKEIRHVQLKNSRSMVAENVASNLASLLSAVGLKADGHTQWKGGNNNDEHYFDSDIVDLLEWEQASLHSLLDLNVTQKSALRTCNPPPGVDRMCCLGAFSNGGATQPNMRHMCAEPMHHLEQVRQHTIQFFEENPIQEGEMACDICRIVDLARRHNLTIALLGDSMHNQVHDGLSCELERRHYNVTKSFVDNNPENYPTWIYRRYARSDTLHIRSPTWSSPEEVVQIHFHRIYLVPLINDDLAALTAQADVLVLGIGLHFWYDDTTGFVFRRKASYVEGMKHLFQNITKQGRVKLLVHRETSAQHFDADGGEWSLWYNNRTNLRKACQPTRYNDTSVLWREKAIQRAARKADHKLVTAGPNMMPRPSSPNSTSPEVVVLPYFNFTSQHHNMHPIGPDMNDCTHYCSSPFVYYPLWRSLRFAMDREFANQ